MDWALVATIAIPSLGAAWAAAAWVVRKAFSDVARRVDDEVADRIAAVTLVSLGTTREDAILRDDIKHSRANADTKFQAVDIRVKSLEESRTADIERIVRVETSVKAIDKTLERMEHGQEKLAQQIDSRFNMLAETIREMSKRTPI